MAAMTLKSSKKGARRVKSTSRSADQPAKARKYYRARVARTPGAESVLRHLDASGRVCLDHLVDDKTGFSVVLSKPELDLLREEGLRVEIGRELLLDDPSHRVPAGSALVDDVSVDLLMSGFTSEYLDAAQVAERISILASSFPSICHLSILPESTVGYDGVEASLLGAAEVQLLRITNTPAIHSKPGLLLICGTHAREWINPLIAIEFAEQLARNYSPGSVDPDVVVINRIVEMCDTYIIPVINPDGLNFSRHDDVGWRKNRNPAASVVCPGIDNNRNYSVYFGGAGSSGAPCDDVYRGASAFSEIENRNVRFVLEQNPNILVGVDSHSAGQDIFRPGPGGGGFIASLPVSAADHAIYTALENTVVAAIQGVNGVTYSTGSTSNHAGTSDEYMFFGHRVFGFDFECALDFQPPFVDAQMAIHEVVAGLRALANATIDLTVTTPTPARIVQCIDRTGSMVTFGYEAPARANARRFIDMMSLGDSVGVVSFADPSSDPLATPVADRATTELPLTLLDDSGDFDVARTSVDGIVFGGWTPIGAGLQRSADLLAASPAPRAVLLISDGFENRDPSVSDVLLTYPPNLRVFSIALGGAADVPLLQSIATDTGGVFYVSPTELELYEIYNQIRSDMTDDGLVLNDTADDTSAMHVAKVEPGADKLLISVSWANVSTRLTRRLRKDFLQVFSPSGRKVGASDWGVNIIQRADYAIVEILRPAPGDWLICPQGPTGPHTAAAFVKSPLKLRVHTLGDKRKQQLFASAAFEDRPLSLYSEKARLQTLPLPPLAWIKKQRRVGPNWSDQLKPRDAATMPQPKPVTSTYQPLELRGHSRDSTTAGQLLSSLPAGTYNLKLQIEGTLPGGAPFHRVVLRTVGTQ